MRWLGYVQRREMLDKRMLKIRLPEGRRRIVGVLKADMQRVGMTEADARHRGRCR